MAVFEKARDHERSGPPLALPVALLSIAFLGAIGFQTVQLLRDRSSLSSAYVSQDAAVKRTLQLRDSVDSFAGDTAKLAQAGDPQAKQVVDALRGQNITIRPPVLPVPSEAAAR